MIPLWLAVGPAVAAAVAGAGIGVILGARHEARNGRKLLREERDWADAEIKRNWAASDQVLSSEIERLSTFPVGHPQWLIAGLPEGVMAGRVVSAEYRRLNAGFRRIPVSKTHTARVPVDRHELHLMFEQVTVIREELDTAQALHTLADHWKMPEGGKRE